MDGSIDVRAGFKTQSILCSTYLLIGVSRLIDKLFGACQVQGYCGHDRMVVGFTTTCAISSYHHCCEFEPCSWRRVLDTTICDKVHQLLVTGRWFSPVSFTNKTDRHDITETLLKVALNTINKTKPCQVQSNIW